MLRCEEYFSRTLCICNEAAAMFAQIWEMDILVAAEAAGSVELDSRGSWGSRAENGSGSAASTEGLQAGTRSGGSSGSHSSNVNIRVKGVRDSMSSEVLEGGRPVSGDDSDGDMRQQKRQQRKLLVASGEQPAAAAAQAGGQAKSRRKSEKSKGRGHKQQKSQVHSWGTALNPTEIGAEAQKVSV